MLPVYSPKIAVVIPCYRVKAKVLGVLQKIGAEVSLIVAVDDACPEHSGQFMLDNCKDSRLVVLFHEKNSGVGQATLTGLNYALKEGSDIVVKIDGDGQINPELVPNLIAPMINQQADYVKGNRFYSLANSRQMPGLRKFGNLVLSFMSKFSSGYHNIFDPTNGFVAIHKTVAALIPQESVSKRYFFESDLLFHLGLARAVVVDFPMQAVYQDEVSNLRVNQIVVEFLLKYSGNFFRRVLTNYFLRDFNIGSIQLVLSLPLLVWGFCFGAYEWLTHVSHGQYASAGTVMLAALPIIVGTQLFLGFLSYDLYNQPKTPLQLLLSPRSLGSR